MAFQSKYNFYSLALYHSNASWIWGLSWGPSWTPSFHYSNRYFVQIDV